MTSSIGDTVSLVARTRLNYGENLIKWELVSGQGKFVDATADSTGFIPSTDSATIRMVTQVLPIYELTEQRTKYTFDKNSVRVPRSRSWGGDYGIRFYFDVPEDGQYAQITEIDQSVGIYNIGTDSTFKTNQDRTCTNHRCFFTAQANTRHYTYVYASGYPNVFMKDSVFVRLSRTYAISASHSGDGVILVDSAKKIMAIDSASVIRSFTKVVENDSIGIYAIPGTNNLFDHWEKVSGSCDIEDELKDTTRIMNIHSDCKVKAIFRTGTVYQISGTPTQYNFTEHTYAKNVSSGSAGVRFLFTAPFDGTYAIVVSNKTTQDSAVYIQYTDTDYKTEAVKVRFIGTHVETMTLSAGDDVAIVIGNRGKSANPFYISSSTEANKIQLTSDGNGQVLPAGGYTTAYAGSKYSISAEAATGYRFSNWQVIMGSPMIDDPNDPYTYVLINDNVELKARFMLSSVYSLSETAQTFNFLQSYYSESTHSETRFTWTPPDTNTYVIQIIPDKNFKGIFREYESDKTFTTISAESEFSEASSFIFRGTPGVPLYWVIRDSSNNIPNISFSVRISSPYILNIRSAKEGSTNPSGKVYTSSGVKNIVTAWPHGGYKFKSWIDIDGDMTIADTKNSRTSVILKDSVCTIKATFEVDKSAEPSLNISNLDISNYPEICAQVSVTDKNTGSSFYGLVSDDFTLTQDGEPLQPQVTSINNVKGVSVVIVVDQSNSMHTNKRMDKAKDAIRSFVNNMGPYDRTAIVGFVGNVYVTDPSSSDTIRVDSTIVHQAMTSNKTLLLNSIDGIKAVGGSTNIITGTYIGVQQIVNETNATAVIVFSDGDNNSGTTNLLDVIDLAQKKNTPIYSIGLETDIKYPLENMATSTGGTFSFASDASELGGLYAAIRDNVMSQYVVCFQTPDTTQNGETHDVVIGMTFNKIKT
ncbi:MAG: VWA domain-containing protein, partial [Fibrobacter sp.]|nr:VWA domain-containing protein [Fibrobacter sp.]